MNVEIFLSPQRSLLLLFTGSVADFLLQYFLVFSLYLSFFYFVFVSLFVTLFLCFPDVSTDIGALNFFCVMFTEASACICVCGTQLRKSGVQLFLYLYLIATLSVL